jgi:uncharacterized protein YbbC (DUF1343 family)
LHGVQLHITQAREFRPLRTSLTMLGTLQRLYGDQLKLEDGPVLGKHWGTLSVFDALRAGKSAAEIEAAWQPQLADFEKRRALALIYE